MSRRRIGGIWLALAAFTGGMICAPQADAYQIKRVIRGACLVSAVETISVDLVNNADCDGTPSEPTDNLLGTPVDDLDLNTSLLLFTNSAQSTDRSVVNLMGVIDDPTSLLFARVRSTTATTVDYMVVEFAAGVSVASGMTTFSDGTTGTALLKTIALPSSFELTKSFPLISIRSFGPTNAAVNTDERNVFLAQLTDATHLRLERSEGGNPYNADVAYQVIQFDGAETDAAKIDILVQKNDPTNPPMFNATTESAKGETLDRTTTPWELTVSQGDDPSSASLVSITPFDPAKSFLLFTVMPGTASNGNEEYYAIRGEFANCTTTCDQLKFTRITSGQPVTINWSIVTFKNAAYGQRAVQALADPGATGAQTTNVTLSSTPALVLARSFSAVSTSLGAAGVTTGGLDDLAVRAQLNASNQLVLTREIASSASNESATVSWFAVELPPFKLTSPNGDEVWKVNDVRTIGWEHADNEANHMVDLLLTTTASAGDSCSTTYPLTIASGLTVKNEAGGGDALLNQGSYSWTIPPTISTTDLIGTSLRVMIKDNALTSPYNCDLSNTNFQIKGALSSLVPAGGESWVVGESRNITWNNRGNFNGQSMTGTLAYSTTGGTCSTGTWTTISSTVNLGADTGTGGSNSVPWTVDANAIGTSTLVKLSLNSESAPVQTCLVSAAAFTVKRGLTLTAPIATDTFESKKQYDITWDYQGNPVSAPSYGTVKLEFSPNNGTSWYPIDDGAFPENAGASALAVDAGSAPGNNPPYDGKGRFYWKVQDAAISAGQAKVRVTSNADGTVVSTSAAFTINPSVRVDTPNGGAPTKYVDTTETIAWTCSPAVNKMKIELRHSTDGVIYNSTLIATGQPAANVDATHGQYTAWSVGDFISAFNKIRLTGQDAGGLDLVPAVQDDSDADFTIHGRIDNVSPTGGSYSYGASVPVMWTPHGAIGNVRVKLSSNGGGDGYPTDLSGLVLGSAGVWSWPTGTTALGSTYKVRVIEDAHVDVYGDSAANFNLKGVISGITYPNDGTEIFPVGSNQTITWARSPNNATFEPFEVRYSLDNGLSWTLPNGDVICAAATGTSCAWNNIPATALTTQLRIKVCLAADPTNCRTNDNAAKIRGTLTLTVPNGHVDPNLTDTWYVGDTKLITWNPSPAAQGNVRLVFSTDGGTNYPEPDNIIATVASETLSRSWTVPALAQDEGVKIKVYNVNDIGVNDQSDYDFKIRGGLDITSPDGGAPFLVVGDPKNITWTSSGTISTVRLYYSSSSTAGPWTELAGGPVTNVNAYLWPSVADAIGTATRIKVQDATFPTTENVSASDFEIKGDVVFDPSAPPANAILRVGGNYLVQWTKKGTLTTPTANIKLLYSINDGSTFPDPANVIATVTGTSHNWLTIPDAARSDTVKLKVQWEGDAANVYEVSPQIKVKPAVDLTSPDTGTYSIGTALPVTFTHTGRSTDIFRVLYSTNGGSTYPNPSQVIGTVTDGVVTPANGFTLSCTSTVSPVACTWTVPNIAGIVDNDIKIKVELVGDEANVLDESAGNLTTRGTLAVTYPTATGVEWTVAETNRTITWNAQGITLVRIDYTKDNGVDNYANSITTSGSGGNFTWNPIPPEAVCDACKIRIKANDTPPLDNATEAFSANAFRIKPKLTLTYPTGGEVFVVGTSGPDKIRWTYSGALDFVEIYYTTDTTGDLTGDGIPDPPEVTWVPIAVGGGAPPAGLLEYTWPSVPDDITTTARVVVRKKNDSAVKDIKNSYFKIRGSVNVDQPTAAGLRLPIATTYDIKWTPTGTLGNVKLEYSTNGFADEMQTFPVLGPLAVPANNLPAGASGVQQSFAWEIPNAPSPSVKVRATSLSDATVLDVSNNALSIIGSLFVDAPNGPSDIWAVGESRNIQWHKLGNISNVDLYYSKDGGADNYPFPIATLVPAGPESGSSLSWPSGVPNDIGDQLKIKILDSADSTVSDVSNASFLIKGSLIVTSPNSATTRYVGDPLTVAWTPSGTIGPVTIQYSTNAFADELQTTTVVSSYQDVSNAYAMTVPNAISDTVRFRVKSQQSNANLVAGDVSDADFAIKGKIVLQPLAAEYTLGDAINVQWTPSGSIGNVKVEYYDGSGWTPVTTTAPEAGPYNFTLDAPTVPAVATNLAKIRVSDASDSLVLAESPAFMVKPLLSVSAPASGNTWTVGSGQPITWAQKGVNISTVKIEYSSNGGSTYQAVLESEATPNDGIVANDNSFTWTVPDEIGASPNLKIKISTIPVSDPWAVVAYNSGTAQIIGGLALTTPNDATGIQWRINSTGNLIGWNATGSIANVKLDYSTDSGSTWSPLAASAPSGAGAGKSYSWNLPATTPIAKDTVRLRACDAANTNVCDTANANSSFLANFAVVHPMNGDVWVAEDTHTIEWSTPQAGVPSTVKLEISYDNGSTWANIPETYGTANDGIVSNSGTQNVTLGMALSNAAKGRISDPADANSVMTGTAFKIRGDLTMTAPNTGTESWDVASYHGITWTKKGNISAVKLQLSTDGGSSYSALVDGDAANTQNIDVSGVGPYSFNWRVPDAAGILTTQARIRVMDANDATVYDPSNSNFTLKGAVQLSNPNGGILTVGVPSTINGTVFGPIGTVSLYLSTNGGSTYAPLPTGNCDTVAVSGGAFSCNWNVPDTLGSTMKIKVTDANNGAVLDESDAVFGIKGSATITAPVSGNIWFAGDPHTIVWDRTGTIGNVDLSYSVNDGTYQAIASGLASPLATGNTYAWTLPTSAIVSSNVKVKVDSANLVAPFITPAFTVKGKLTLTYPDAAGIERVLGDAFNVTWNVAGDIGPVKVEYYDGAAWSTLTTTASQAGPYSLTLDTPNTTIATAAAKVRISDADEATVVDESANAFMVRPLLAVTAPSGNEAWVVGSTHPVTWNAKGSNVSNVKLEYSKDSGATYPDVIAASTANDGAYDWLMPDDIQPVKNMKVRVSSLPITDPYAVTAASTGLFQIIGALEMATPNDTTGIKWRVGSTANQILWNATGSIANVKLDYSVDGGSTWSPLAASAPSGAGAGKSYSWNLPATTPIAKDTVRLRACDAANTNVCDLATATSSFLAGFMLIHPMSGDVWVAENTHTVEWNTPTPGVPSTVKLEYTLDGTTYSPIPETYGTANDGIVANGGGQNWTLGTGLSTAAKVRISDPADMDSTWIGTNFKVRGDLTMTSPTAGTESWELATTQPITWTKKGDIATVKLQLSTDGGTTYNALVDGTTPTPQDTQNIGVSGVGPFTFNWVISDTQATTTQARIRVVDAADSTVLDASNNNFTLKGRVQLSNPNGGQTLPVGTPYTINGTVFGPIGTVNLYLSTNGGSTYAPLPTGNCDTAAVSLGAFSCNWNVPDALGSTMKIKVTDANNGAVLDESDAVFGIKGSATITAPVSGNILFAGDVFNIVWDRTGTIGNVDLFYNVNDGAYQSIAGGLASPLATGNTYAWTLPTSAIVSPNVKVKVDGANLVAPFLTPAFQVKGKLTLTYPDAAGIERVLGDAFNVTWNVAGDIGPVKVEYYDGAAWSTLTTTASQAGPFSLLLDAPNTTVATNAAKVRISDADEATVVDESANAFMVRPLLAVTAPSGNEAWVVGSTHPVTWNAKGSNIANVKIEYSKDSGATYADVIAASTANDGAHGWTIPDDIQSVKNMKVRVSSLPITDPYAVTAASTGLFQIIGALEMATPNDTTGIKWRVGSTANEIKWNATGSIANVKLDYSTDSGSTWTTLVASTPSGAGVNKTYAWNVPTAQPLAKDTFRIQALDAANTNVFDVAIANSSILADFSFLHPLAGEVWVAETSRDIEWTTPIPGVPTNVKLEYTLDGSTWSTVVTSTPNTGIKSWTLPSGLSQTAKVRISDVNDLVDSRKESNAFKIRGELTMTAPNTGTESWEVNTTHAITWTKKGNVAAAKLLLSTDGGTTYSVLVDGTTPTPQDTQNIDISGPGPTYAFNWVIPDQPGITTTQARLRVMDASDATVYDSADANFTIKGRVELLTPNGGETLTVGVPYAVTGNVYGPIPTVKLYYSTNGGATYPNPVEGCASVSVSLGSFSCNWAVPDALGSNLKIRAEDASNPAVNDASVATFSIKGGATVTAPVSGNILFAGDVFNLVWDRTGTIGNVDLSYSVNDGTYQAIASGLASPLATGNTYAWTLPTSAIVSSNVKVKVDGANLVAPALSAAFTVKGKLTLTYPDAAGIQRALGDTFNVTWNVAGDIGPVKVEYYDGLAWSTLTTTAPQAGPYSLTLDTPNTTIATAAAKVRISDADDATVVDTSANDFMVKPYLQVTSPAGNESWVVDSIHALTWNQKGSNVSSVEIRYSKNSGATYDDLIAASAPNTGSFGWTIPNDIQTVKNMKVKVSTLPLTDPYAVTALSTGLFQIIGALEMVTPNDATGIKWRVDSTANEIKWNATGSVVNVRLEYSTNSGSTWAPIIASTPSGAGTNKTYSWNVPSTLTPTKDTVRIRALDAADTNVYDVATANSSFLADFTFVHPLVGEVWVAETSRDVEWTTPVPGVPTNVKLEYTLDGSTWNTLTASTLNSGLASWTLPTGISQNAKVRISDANDQDSAKESASFKIRGDLTVTAPNTGTESWELATTQAITWTKKGSITAIKLLISTDGGVSYSPLVDGTTPTPQDTQNISVSGAGPFTFNWVLPDSQATTTQARLRVMDASDATVYDSADNNFVIKGRVQMTAPNGGQTLPVGSAYNITGTVFGPIPNVKLYYSTDGLTFPNPVLGCETVAVAGGAFSCNWSVPDAIGTSLKIKVEDAANPAVSDVSDAVFAVKGNATLTAPVTGNIWEAGQSHQIRWDRSGTIGNVDLSYSVNAGAWSPIANGLPSPAPTGNSYDWTLPTTGIVSTNVKVRVDGVNLLAPVDSNAFTVKGKLILSYPDAAGITATLGDTINVTWNVAGDIGPVKVEYFDGSVWSLITSAAPQAGPFGLLLDAPNTTMATAQAKVRISDPDDATVTDESANFFTARPLVALTAPAGNEAWVVGSTQNVTWNKKGDNVGTVKLEYSKDGGLTYNDTITASTANDGSYGWLIPDDIQPVANMKVRLSTLPTSDPYAVTAASNGLFKITGALAVTAPQAIDRWGVGTIHDIKWTRTGSVANVRITYSTDGSTYNPIIDSYPGGNGDTGYSWTIPNVAGIVSNTVTVRVADVADSSVLSLSPQFKIVPSFTVTAPALDQRVTVNRPFDITWTRQGLNPTVNLYYSLDGFSGPGILIAAGVSNTGTYSWSVPDQAALAGGFVPANVRVAYPDDETVFDDSDPFRLVTGYTLTAPNSTAHKWDVGSNQVIRWTSTSANVPAVKLHYSIDGGATYPFQLTAGTSNAGAPDAERTWNWMGLPDTLTAQLKVRVMDLNDSAAADESDSNAKLKAFFQVLTPSATGVILKVNAPYNITWNWDGTVPNVRIDYSLDDFVAVTNITPTTPNDGVFEWTVPDNITTLAKIRVRSTTDVDGQDVSDNAFKIEAQFMVQTPNGGESFSIGFPHDLTWNTVGSVAAVHVVAYSTLGTGDAGFPYAAASPYVIASGLANTPNASTTYSWNPVPDMASPNMKVRILDAADATVSDDSDAAFKIQGAFTVTYPNAANETLRVGDVATLTWNPTGSSITDAKISYSLNGASGPWTLMAENEGTPDDGIVANDGSATWAVPDVLSVAPAGLPKTNMMLKIEDPNDATVFDLSDNPFAVTGRFTVVTPAGGERWVVNENHLVSWNTYGKVTAVDVAYSTDDFATPVVIAGGLTNVPTGYSGAYPYFKSYNWTVPDGISANAKVRVMDVNDPTVIGDSNAFLIDYYYITFEVRDLLSNAHISTLNVNAAHTLNPGFVWNASAQNSPIVKGLAAGPWAVTFTQSNFGDQSAGFVADQDQTVVVLMETKVVHVWEAISEIAYSASTDTASIATTLKRDGITVSGASAVAVEFFIPGNPVAVRTFSNPVPPDANGFYNFTWTPPTGLNPGIVYNVVTTIDLAATGAQIKTPRTFTIAQEVGLQNVTNTVNQQLDVPLSQVEGNITTAVNTQLTTQQNFINTTLTNQTTLLQTQLQDQSNTITTQMSAQTQAIETQVDQKLGQFDSRLISLDAQLVDFDQQTDTNIQSLKTGVDQGVTDITGAGLSLQINAEKSTATNKQFGGILIYANEVLLGQENVKIVYQADTDLKPKITILVRSADGKEKEEVKDADMTVNPTQPDMYEYVIKKIAAPPYLPGQPVSVIVKAVVFTYELDPEKVGQTMEATKVGSFMVTGTTLDDVASSVSSLSGMGGKVSETLRGMRSLQATFGGGATNISDTLGQLSTQMEKLPAEVKRAAASATQGQNKQITSTLNEVAKQIQTLAGDNMGFDFSQIVGKALEESSGLKQVREKTTAVQGTTEIMQILLEQKLGGHDAPIVHTILQ